MVGYYLVWLPLRCVISKIIGFEEKKIVSIILSLILPFFFLP